MLRARAGINILLTNKPHKVALQTGFAFCIQHNKDKKKKKSEDLYADSFLQTNRGYRYVAQGSVDKLLKTIANFLTGEVRKVLGKEIAFLFMEAPYNRGFCFCCVIVVTLVFTAEMV